MVNMGENFQEENKVKILKVLLNLGNSAKQNSVHQNILSPCSFSIDEVSRMVLARILELADSKGLTTCIKGDVGSSVGGAPPPSPPP